MVRKESRRKRRSADLARYLGARPRRPRRWPVIVLFTVPVLFAILAALLYFGRAALIRTALTRIEEQFALTISYDTFVFDLRYGAAANNVAISRGGTRIADAARLSAAIHWPSLLKGRIAVSGILIDGLSADAHAVMDIAAAMGTSSNSTFSIEALTITDARIRYDRVTVRGALGLIRGRITADVSVNGMAEISLVMNGNEGEAEVSVDWRSLMPRNQFTALTGIDAAVSHFSRSAMLIHMVMESNAISFSTKAPFVFTEAGGKRTQAELFGAYRIADGSVTVTASNAVIAGVPAAAAFGADGKGMRFIFSLKRPLALSLPALGAACSVRGSGAYDARGLSVEAEITSLWYTNALLKHPFHVPKASVSVSADTLRPISAAGRYGSAAFVMRIPQTPLYFTNLRAAVDIASFDLADVIPASGSGEIMPVELSLSVKRLSVLGAVFDNVRAVMGYTPEQFSVSGIRAELGRGAVSGEYRIRFTETPPRHVASFSAEGVHLNRVVKDMTGNDMLYGTAEANADADFTLGSIADVWANGFFSLTASVKDGRIKKGVYLDSIYGKLGRASPEFEYFDELTLSGGINNGGVIAERITIRGDDKEYHLSGGAYHLARKELSIRSNELYVSESFRDRYIPNPLYLAGLFRPSRPGWFIVGPFSYDKGTVVWGQ